MAPTLSAASSPDPGDIEARRPEETTDVVEPSLGPPGAAEAAAVLPGAGLTWLIRDPRIRDVARLVGLGWAVWLSLEAIGRRPPGADGVALAGVSLAGLAWLAWVVAGRRRRFVAVSLGFMAAGGGVAAGAAPTGLIFVGVAAAGAAFAFELLPAVALLAGAAVGFVGSAAALGHPYGRVLDVGAVALAGLVVAGGRRELFQRARQATLLATERRRTEIATREARLVAERNRLGRELHDVLAHTLGAVSIHLTALDAQLSTGAEPDAVRAGIQRLHGLVGEGLDEARLAVRALRGESRPLADQLRPLCAIHGASFEVHGALPVLAPDATLALYRVAQEALTNAAKYAPGASVGVRLAYDEESRSVMLEVRNDDPEPGSDHPLARTGGGYGLAGIRERMALVGGRCSAGPVGQGWRVGAEVPL